MKPCKVCDRGRGNLHGLVAASLDELRSKGCKALGLELPSSVCVVLEEDGTIVGDETYFLCLPPNTKFMLLCNKERWAPSRAADGGTAWLSRSSFEVDLDTVDTALSGAETWRDAASRLRVDLANVLLLSEAELQSVVDAPCSDLAGVLDFRDSQARALQDALQRALDRREEERRSRELLELYLKTVEREGRRAPSAGGETSVDNTDSPAEGTSSTFSPRTLMVLKGKTRPETRLSNEDLQKVVSEGTAAMATAVGWDTEKCAALVAACEAELCNRLERVRVLRSLSARSPQAETDPVRAKRKK